MDNSTLVPSIATNVRNTTNSTTSSSTPFSPRFPRESDSTQQHVLESSHIQYLRNSGLYNGISTKAFELLTNDSNGIHTNKTYQLVWPQFVAWFNQQGYNN